MTTKEFSALVGWPYSKLMRRVSKIPGAVLTQDADGRRVWDIPEAAALAPPFLTPPAAPERTQPPGEPIPPTPPPPEAQDHPPRPEPTANPPRTHGPISWKAVAAALVVLALMMHRTRQQPPQIPKDWPPSY